MCNRSLWPGWLGLSPHLWNGDGNPHRVVVRIKWGKEQPCSELCNWGWFVLYLRVSCCYCIIIIIVNLSISFCVRSPYVYFRVEFNDWVLLWKDTFFSFLDVITLKPCVRHRAISHMQLLSTWNWPGWTETCFRYKVRAGSWRYSFNSLVI